MIRTLKQYNLEFSKTIDYFLNHIEGGNTLSSEILKNHNFQLGKFYTLLPSDEINESDLYVFNKSILPMGPPEKKVVAGKKYIAREVNHTKEELEEFLHNLLKKNNHMTCVFEDVLHLPTDKRIDRVENGVFQFNNEIYYILDSTNLSQKRNPSPSYAPTIINLAFAIWHFLCVVFENNSVDIHDNEMTLKNIKKILANARLIIVGAYDGDGFLFWEKNEK